MKPHNNKITQFVIHPQPELSPAKFSPLWWILQYDKDSYISLISNTLKSTDNDCVSNGGHFNTEEELIAFNNKPDTNNSLLYSLFEFEKTKEGHGGWENILRQTEKCKAVAIKKYSDLWKDPGKTTRFSHNSPLYLLAQLDPDLVSRFFEEVVVTNSHYKFSTDDPINELIHNNNDPTCVNFLPGPFILDTSLLGSAFWVKTIVKIEKQLRALQK